MLRVKPWILVTPNHERKLIIDIRRVDIIQQEMDKGGILHTGQDKI